MFVAFVPMGPGHQNRPAVCFSSTASFAASAILTGAGVLAFRAVRRSGWRALAMIPLIFAVQQFIEGWLWLGLNAPGPVNWLEPATRAYLVFAQMLWPIWVPFAMMGAEEDRGRRIWLRRIIGIGAVVAAYHGLAIFGNVPQASIEGHHVHYTLEYPWHARSAASVLYALATVFAVFISSVPRMWALGLALFASWALAAIFFPGNVISVWCYFAALISVVIIHLLQRSRSVVSGTPV
jgi:hypothetical protein